MRTVRRTIDFTNPKGREYRLEDVEIGITSDHEIVIVEIPEAWEKFQPSSLEVRLDYFALIATDYAIEHIVEIEQDIMSRILDEKADYDIEDDKDRIREDYSNEVSENDKD